MVADLFTYWEQIVMIATLAVFFALWRADSSRSKEAQEKRDQAILQAVVDVVKAVRESRSQAAEEHASLARLFERLDEHTVNEHRALEKALERLSTSLEHHIADERSKR